MLNPNESWGFSFVTMTCDHFMIYGEIPRLAGFSFYRLNYEESVIIIVSHLMKGRYVRSKILDVRSKKNTLRLES